MKKQYRYAYNALKKLGVPVYERSDLNGRFNISAEDAESYKWCDYYYQGNEWDFGVNPLMESNKRMLIASSVTVSPKTFFARVISCLTPSSPLKE